MFRYFFFEDENSLVLGSNHVLSTHSDHVMDDDRKELKVEAWLGSKAIKSGIVSEGDMWMGSGRIKTL